MQEVGELFENECKLGYMTVEALPGAYAIIDQFKIWGVPQAIATSSTSGAVEEKRASHENMFETMEHIITGDQVCHGKPHPEIFLKAAEELGVPPSECLVFEDSPAGVAAALAAGMAVVAIPDARIVQRTQNSQTKEIQITDLGMRASYSNANVIVETLEGLLVEEHFDIQKKTSTNQASGNQHHTISMVPMPSVLPSK
jgi:beta-phosphoglucomutase-like phosphatase (HAD superfamily)